MNVDIQSRARLGLVISSAAVSLVSIRAKFLQSGMDVPTFIRITGETTRYKINDIQRQDVGVYDISWTGSVLGDSGGLTNSSYAYIVAGINESNFFMNVQATPISSSVLRVRVVDQRGYPSDVNGYLSLFIDFESR